VTSGLDERVVLAELNRPRGPAVMNGNAVKTADH